MREILALLPKPSRYLGIEEGAAEVDLSKTRLHTVLAFPDMYEVGMSYLGHKILYNLLNNHPEITAERVFTPAVKPPEFYVNTVYPSQPLKATPLSPKRT